MSENIQSISQGTYTIGQTSATNFVAGQGIKIDSPSAGTVRIGNDETVLYENSNPQQLTSSATYTLSEPFTNFEKIEVQCDASFGDIRYIKLVNTRQYSTATKQLRLSLSEPGMGQNQDTNIYFDRSNLLFNINTPNTVSGFGAGSRLGISGTTISYTNNRGASVRKIIGINRISGGNE